MVQNYYGVSWNFVENSYRATGILSDMNNYKDAVSQMFIHNTVNKQDGEWKTTPFYIKQTQNDTEVTINISQIQLPGFELCRPESCIVAGILYFIEHGVWQSFDCPDTR